jgi:FKBP-type peptidyl-prolyl cis-trans isomerase 2
MNRTDAICLVVVALIIVGVVSLLAYSWYQDATKEPKKDKTEILFVQEGDTITAHFTEWIFTRDENGKVDWHIYQTTDKTIAENESIPKSITFSKILINATNVPITREPITAIVGLDLTDEVTSGFNDVVIDMKEGETKNNIEIPIDKGYGDKTDELIVLIPYVDTIPIYNSINRLAFEAEYNSELPLEPGKSFTDHYWNWTIRIDSVTNDTVVVKHEPRIGTDITVFNWPAIVEDISSEEGKIYIKHKPENSVLFSPIDVEVLEFYSPKFKVIKDIITETQQPYPGIITSIDNEGITIDFNRENIGKKIKYDVTITTIIRD